MRFGAVFPTTEIGNDPIAIRDFAQAAEDLGYARLTAYDHVLGAEHANRTPPLTQAGGSIMSIRTMSTGAAYMKVPVPNFAKPAQHIEALAVFMREMDGE